MNKQHGVLFLALFVAASASKADVFGTGTNQFTMDFVQIGFPSNSVDTTGYGAVDYTYRIGTYEVTIDQLFKAQTEDQGIIDGWKENYWNTGSFSLGVNAPAVWMDWSECCRFCNFLTSGDSSLGAYTVSNGIVIAIDRASALLNYDPVYVISDEDEWYKAAYFKPDGSGYSLYANGLSTAPAMTTEANYNGAYNGSSIPEFFTPWPVGSGAAEQNGTYDMMGNIWERLENPIAGGSCRSGTYTSPESYLLSTYRRTLSPGSTEKSFGLRVVALAGTIPPPPPLNITIGNLSVVQRAGSKLIDIYYDLTIDQTNQAAISLTVSNGASVVASASVTGDVGSGISTGLMKHIVWNAGADWGGNSGLLTFMVSAAESGGSSFPAPVAKTGQSVWIQTGGDGDLNHGVDWPNPRFTLTGSGTAIDNLTGLEWVIEPAALPGNSGIKSWQDALIFCSGLSYAGQSDWRLPNQKELLSLIDFSQSYPPLPAGHPFIGIGVDDYWTGSSHPTFPSSHAGSVYMTFGMIRHILKSTAQRTWPVRGGSDASPAPVPKTGQSTSFFAGDDGALQAGTAWPSPRFTDNGDGTVLDNLTGLEWVKEPHALSGNAAGMSWSNAVAFCEGLTFASESNWHLPNIKELESVVSWGGTNEPYAWLNSAETPFSGLLNQPYWSGTSLDANNGWYANMYYLNGPLTMGPKVTPHYVWPVRSPSVAATPVAQTSAKGAADTRNYTLTVSSPFGNPVPGIGTHSNWCWKSTVTASVDAAVSVGGTNYSSSGWTGSGTLPVLGSGTNAVLTLNAPVSSIHWKWVEDQDLDRIPGDWELLYFGSETGAVATADTDGDGYTAWQEYILGSNPTNQGSSFLFTPSPSQPTNSAFSVDFSTVTGRLYTVECTDDLGSGNWQVLTNFVGDGSSAQVIDPASIPSCFYHIRIDWTP